MKEDADYIKAIESQCFEMSKDIINRLCKRAIKKMNKLDSYLAGSTDDYPSGFNFFDVLCIELESKSFDEINPCLQEYVEGTVLDEYRNLPKAEKFFVDHCYCREAEDGETEEIEKMVMERFHEMRMQHLDTKKIENYMLK